MDNLAILKKLPAVFLPEPLVARLYPRRPVYRGAMIDPKAYVVGELSNAMTPPEAALDIERGRQKLRDVAARFDARATGLARTEDLVVQGAEGPLAARLYTDHAAGGPARPAMVYYHGGGFVQGDLDSHQHTCAKLAKWWGGVVIAVDYRLAPEHPFPAAPEDAIAAFGDIHARAGELGIDPARLGVGGDSAGGCLAAVVAQQQVARAGPRPWFQMLAYPAVDGTFSAASIRELRDAYVLPYDILLKLRAAYAGGWQDFTDPRFSPLFGQDFAELPQSFLLTGGFDPLQYEGAEYASRLRAAGVRVDHSHFAGEIHGFISLTRLIPQGTVALQQIAGWLRGLG